MATTRTAPEELSDELLDQFTNACIRLPEKLPEGMDGEALRRKAGKLYYGLIREVLQETNATPALPPVLTVYPGRAVPGSEEGFSKPDFAVAIDNPDAIQRLKESLTAFYEPFASRHWAEEDRGISADDKTHHEVANGELGKRGRRRQPFDPSQEPSGRHKNTKGHVHYYKYEASEEEKKDSVYFALLLARDDAISRGSFLRALRVYSGRGQEDMGGLLGLGQSGYSDLENRCVAANRLRPSDDPYAFAVRLEYALKLLGEPVTDKNGKTAWSNPLNLPVEQRDDLDPPGMAVTQKAAELFLKTFGHNPRSHANKYGYAHKAKTALSREHLCRDIAEQVDAFKTGKLARSEMMTILEAWHKLASGIPAETFSEWWRKNEELRHYFNDNGAEWSSFKNSLPSVRRHDVIAILQKELHLEDDQLALVLKLPRVSVGENTFKFHPERGRDMIEAEQALLLQSLARVALGEIGKNAHITPNEWLGRWREAVQLSQGDVAERRSGISHQAIQQFENDRAFIAALIPDKVFDDNACLFQYRRNRAHSADILSPSNPYSLPTDDKGEIRKDVAENLRRLNDMAVERWLAEKQLSGTLKQHEQRHRRDHSADGDSKGRT